MSEDAQVVAPDTATDTPVQTPEVETPASDASGAPETVVETEEEKKVKELAEQKAVGERAKRNIQKRFNEMTAEKRELMELVKQQQQLLSQRQGQPQQPQAQSGPPKREDYPTYEDFIDAKAEYAAARRFQALVQQQTQVTQEQAQAQQLQSVQQNYARQLQEYEAKNPGFLEAINRDDIEVPDALGSLLPFIPDAPVVLKAIADNPAIANELNRHAGNPAALLVMLGKLTASSKAAPQTSKAPPPGKPVGANAGTSTSPPEDPDAYMAWRKKHMR